MIRINKVTTKQGDSGSTLGPNFHKISKASLEIEILGKLDEVNAHIGNILNYTENDEKSILETIQNQIFDISSDFFNGKDNYLVEFILILEDEIDRINKTTKELDSFLIPSGSLLISALNIARCSARSCEREFWKQSTVPNIGIYLNRLSDLLFVITKKYATKKWIPRQNQTTEINTFKNE